MNRSVFPYLFLVLVPTGTLAFFAFQAAERDYRDGVAMQRVRLGEEADALARRIESAVSDSARRADAAIREATAPGAGAGSPDEAVGFARTGEWLGYAPPTPGPRPLPPPAEELRWFELSLRGGESYEFALRDPARALDAYSFYLPRLRSPALRGRLQFRSARAALASGETALGTALLQQLLDGPAEAEEDGLPLDVLAAVRLGDREKLAGLVRKNERRLPTPLLAYLLRTALPGDPALERAVEKRRALEAALASHPEVLGQREAVLEERCLLLARPLPGESATDSPRKAIVLQPVELPRLEAGDLQARLEYSARAAVPGDAGLEGTPRAVRPVRLGEQGSELASLEVRDPGFEGKLASLKARRSLQRALVGLLVLSTLGGGMALLKYLARERNLARLRARLLANVSHELKTPITSIRMFSEMLAEDPLDEARTRRFGALLRAESQRLSQLIENLLDFSCGASEAPLVREPLDLGALLGQVAEGFSFRAREKGVEFRFQNGVPTALHSNAHAVERIVLNLLDNALKYRGKESPWIRLEAEEADGRVRVTVSDNGIGIPRGEEERIFEEFYRVRYDDFGVQGSGLGLTLARRLARKLGGEVTLESGEGQGSAFTLTLPTAGRREAA